MVTKTKTEIRLSYSDRGFQNHQPFKNESGLDLYLLKFDYKGKEYSFELTEDTLFDKKEGDVFLSCSLYLLKEGDEILIPFHRLARLASMIYVNDMSAYLEAKYSSRNHQYVKRLITVKSVEKTQDWVPCTLNFTFNQVLYVKSIEDCIKSEEEPVDGFTPGLYEKIAIPVCSLPKQDFHSSDFLKYLRKESEKIPEDECFHLNCLELGNYSLFNYDNIAYSISFTKDDRKFNFKFSFQKISIKLESDSENYEDVVELLNSLGFRVTRIKYVSDRQVFESEDDVIEYVQKKFNKTLEKGFHLTRIEPDLRTLVVVSKNKIITYTYKYL